MLPKEVRYSKRNTKAKAQTNKDSILLFKHFVTAINKDKYEAMRILIHERLHQILNEQVGNRKQEYVNEILDIYNEAKLAIKSNPDKYGHLISAFDTILNPDTYLIILINLLKIIGIIEVKKKEILYLQKNFLLKVLLSVLLLML